MSDDQSRGQFTRWISSTASIIAPASLLSALLFYFGYVSSRAEYEYFGVDVDAIGLSTQDYVMRSPRPLLVPLLVLTLVGCGLLVVHTMIRQRIEATRVTDPADGGTTPQDPEDTIDTALRVAGVAGAVLLGVGVVLVVGYALVRDWALFNLVTPLLFTVGGAAMAYTARIKALLRNRRAAGPDGTGDPDPAADSSQLLRRAASVLLYTVVAASVFWAAATVAQWSGRGQAQNAARNLDRLPRVILDTKERLYLRSPGIEETSLPASEGQTFRYRYRKLRLLIVGHDRMFLVPDAWSASNSTLIVPLDGSVRVQFQFQNQRPSGMAAS